MIAAGVGGDGAGRVSARVDGEPLWFVSPDAALRPSGELFATALLIPSLESPAPLQIAAPVSVTWMENAARVLDVVQEWWGYPKRLPVAPPRPDRDESPPRRFGLCFSGGVDSFHTLLRGDLPVDALVYVHGFDIALPDEARFERYLASVRAIATARGADVIRVATNVRVHPATAAVDWLREHGAAMAAVGHGLAGRIGHLLIAASYPYSFEVPWGSHWRLDPHWSSAALRIHHCGAHLWRTQKLLAIMDDPLVQRFLRVCWENRSDALNCGRCEKCIRTQLILAQTGRLNRFQSFEDQATLARRIADAAPIHGDQHVVYAAMVREGLPAELERAVRSWLDRTKRARNSPRRILRRAGAALARIMRGSSSARARTGRRGGP